MKTDDQTASRVFDAVMEILRATPDDAPAVIATPNAALLRRAFQKYAPTWPSETISELCGLPIIIDHDLAAGTAEVRDRSGTALGTITGIDTDAATGEKSPE